jgi:hypothetical protein
MNKTVRYLIVGVSVLAGGYITYLIYNGIRNEIIDSKKTKFEDANKILDNI